MDLKMKTACILFILLFLVFIPHPPFATPGDPGTVADNSAREHWVDSVYQQMDWPRRIGQLFMARAHSNLPREHIEQVKKAITQNHIGGLCFFQGTPQKQAQLVNEYQALAAVPLMIAIDGEWGLGMRFPEDAISFPRQLTLGAIQDNTLIYEMGKEIARELKAIGVQVNFAPVADVNNNPNNPVINNRSFGENRYNVAAKSYQYMLGLQESGVMACAKHFPGHGDTDVDSHYDLPVINHSRRRLDSIELYPFRVLVGKGLQSVMVAHLNVPALDTATNIATTLSAKTVTGLLKEEMGFRGLIFTDALEMKGVTKHFGPGEVALKAFKAGNDILVLPDNLGTAYARIKEALDKGEITEAEIRSRVLKVLRAKYDLGLHHFKPLEPESVEKTVMSPEAIALKQNLYEQALTVVSNGQKTIPIVDISTPEYATLAIGSAAKTAFQERLDDYLTAKHFQITRKGFGAGIGAIERKLPDFDQIIITLHGMNKYAHRDFGLTNEERAWIRKIATQHKVTLVIFGSPYSLKYFEDLQNIVMAYEEDPLMQDVAAQGLMGAFSIRGQLPVSASPSFPYLQGLTTQNLKRLGYAPPESVGMKSDTLQKIADVVDEMIRIRAAPGCQVLVTRKGKVVYQKAFGHHTYSGNTPVTDEDIYDVASVTKIAATTLSIMKLADEGSLNIHHTLGHYLPALEKTNKASLRMDQVMGHHAGLISWIPFYRETMIGSKYKRPSPKIYSQEKQGKFKVAITDKLFMSEDYISNIWDQLGQSEVRPQGRYRYSDLGFYILTDVVRQQTGTRLDSFVAAQFYAPLGLQRTGFNPASWYPKEHIVPTEEDQYFRMQRVQGYVHDMGCAMLGGVAGHAGLFTNARDLAILMQMLLNHGYYGGKSYLTPEVIHMFTRRIEGSTRRAVGFDMKELDPNRRTFTSELASDFTYGHTGFTGIGVWNDPVHELTYIFLSNRTYPSSRNNKLNRERIREQIHDLIYRSFIYSDRNITFP